MRLFSREALRPTEDFDLGQEEPGLRVEDSREQHASGGEAGLDASPCRSASCPGRACVRSLVEGQPG